MLDSQPASMSADASANSLDRTAFDTGVEKIDGILRRAYAEYPHYERVLTTVCNAFGGTTASVTLDEKIAKFDKLLQPELGVPVRPMLANPIKGMSDVFTRFGTSASPAKRATVDVPEAKILAESADVDVDVDEGSDSD